MLGMWLRDSVTGIGTLTFSDPDSGVFGALGHAVSDADTGLRLEGEGQMTGAQITGVHPGSEGCPGELVGCAEDAQVLGSIERNTPRGVYGVLTQSVYGQSVEAGMLKPGEAKILCTVTGAEPRAYSVQIDRVYNDTDGCRAVLTVTDPQLLSLTGGIVQGMSGSPILQDGKLVGAVTHVSVTT